MKKIIIFLFIVLTSINTASGGFFGDIFEAFFGDSFKEPSDSFLGVGSDVKDIRCKVEYTQLNLATGLEKTVKHTAQYEILYIANGDNLMYLSAQDLTKKINKWLNESPNNIVADMTGINCKEGDLIFSIYYIFHPQMSWDKYKSCEDKYNVDLINLLERPKQWGYNVHKERLIKDYEEGCKNYTSDYIPTDMY
jgi:hypothetical protein